MQLYKFVASKDAVLNMARGNLKFTPIEQLNDPMELVPELVPSDVVESLKALREVGMSEEQFEWLGQQEVLLNLLAPEEIVLRRPKTLAEANRMLTISAYDNLGYMRTKLVSTVKSIRAKVGVLSLTARWDSLAMWAHYASNANGFVVILDNLHEAFPGDGTGSLNVPKPVTYTSEFRGMTFDPATQDRLFFSKFAEWSYEQEWRVVLPLAQCRHVVPPGLYLKTIEAHHFAGVICGRNVPDDIIATLKSELSAINPAAEIKVARIEGAKITLAAYQQPASHA